MLRIALKLGYQAQGYDRYVHRESKRIYWDIFFITPSGVSPNVYARYNYIVIGDACELLAFVL